MPKKDENGAHSGDKEITGEGAYVAELEELILFSLEQYKRAPLNEKTQKLKNLINSIDDNLFFIEHEPSLTKKITEKILKELDFSDLNSFQEKVINDFYNKRKDDHSLLVAEFSKKLKNKIYDDHMAGIQNMPVNKINFSKLILSLEVIREGMIEKNDKNINVDKELRILLNRFDFSKLTPSEVAAISEPASLSPLKKRRLSDKSHRKSKNFLFDKYLEDQRLAEADLLAKKYPNSEPARDFLFHLKVLRRGGEVVNLENAAAAALKAYDEKPGTKNEEKKYHYIKEMIAFLPRKTGKREVTRETIITAIAKNFGLEPADLLKKIEDEKSHSSLFNFNDTLKRVKKVAIKKKESTHSPHSPKKS